MPPRSPVITANYAPFRLVLHETDPDWAPTLDQINKLDYDHVKLHRISAWIDTGIKPHWMAVCFDGTLVLPALDRFRDRKSVLATFNHRLAELLLGGVYCEAASPSDIGTGYVTEAGYVRITHARGPAVDFHNAARSKHIGILDVIRLLEPETIRATHLQQAMQKGQSLLQQLGDIPSDLLLYGTTFFAREQWAEALIHLWTITERIAEIAWRKHVLSGSAVTGKRKAFLEDHRTWPVSTKLEVLSQKGLMPAPTLEALDRVRKARNAFAHRGKVPSREVAEQALKSCFVFASLCASGFSDEHLFSAAIEVIEQRSKPDEGVPRSREVHPDEVRYWGPRLPPIPGDDQWGDAPYEPAPGFEMHARAPYLPSLGPQKPT